MISKSLEFSLLKWNITQFRIIWKNVGVLDFVILDIYLALAIGIVSDHEITQYMHCVMLLCFLKKLLCLACFVVSKYAVYTYEYWDSNDWGKFIGINIYKITEDHLVAASQTKNDHIYLYLLIIKAKKNFFVWKG